MAQQALRAGAPGWRCFVGAGSVAAIDFTPFLTHF